MAAPQAQLGIAMEPAEGIHLGGWVDQGGVAPLARRPDHPLHRQHLLLPFREPPQHHPVGADLHHPGAGSHPNITALQAEEGLFPVEGAGLGQQGLPLFDQFHHGGPAAQVGQLAGQFHPGGATPHHGQPLQGPPRFGQLGEQVLQALHISQAAEAHGVAFRPRHAEGVGGRAGGQHQAPPGQGGAGRGLQGAGRQVDPLHPVLQPAHAMAGQERVVAGGDLPAAQFTAQQLVEQWQKQELFTGLHQQHRRVVALLGEGKGCVQPSESAAHHHHGAGCPQGWLAVGFHRPTLPIPSCQG